MIYNRTFKRFFDLLISTSCIILLLPIGLLISILIKLTSKGTIFFLQKRLGKDGQIFNIYKFRTMTSAKREVKNEIFSKNPDVTVVGTVLRRLKLDETPQLLNVFLGEMSLVGPRPCTPELLLKFNKDGFERLRVKPGLTGLAQINGNIYLSWEDRWYFDKLYVERISFILDVKIITKTFLVILLGEKRFLKRTSDV